MPQTMFDDPDGTLAMLRDSVAGFAAQNPGAKTLRERRAAKADLNRNIWSGMAEAGWLGLSLPEAMGGLGLGMREQAVLSEALGRELISEPLAQLAVFAGSLVAAFPASAEAQRLGQGIADGSLIVSPLWQGRDAGRASAVIKRSGNALLLSGDYHFVSAPSSATEFLVVAESDEGLALASVDAKSEGISVGLRPSVDGSRIGSITLSRVEISGERVVATGPDVEDALARAIEVTRLALAAELAGIASRALEITVGYTRNRVQFGKPIASFQAVQHRLVDMWGDAEFACAAVVNAAETAVSGEIKDATLATLAAKARAGDAAVSVTRRSVHLHGAMGFTDECDIGLYLKRAINLNATLGQPEALRLQFVALERAA